jgi:hypothetical protein
MVTVIKWPELVAEDLQDELEPMLMVDTALDEVKVPAVETANA